MKRLFSKVKNFVKGLLNTKLLRKIRDFIKRRKKLSIFIGIILVLIIIAFINAGSKDENTMATPTAAVVREDIEYHVKVNGIVKAANEQTILAPVQGIIKEINVEQGDTVEEGQILAVIDTAEIDAQIEKARVQLELEKSRLKKSQNEFETAKRNLKDLEQRYNHLKQIYDANVELYKQEAISQQKLNEAKMAMDSAYNEYISAKENIEAGQDVNLQKEQILLAELEYKRLMEEKEKHFIKSPITGTVGEIFEDEGMLIIKQNQFMYIVNNNEMEMSANVSEYDAKHIQIGNQVKISSHGTEGQSYETVISYISPYAKRIATNQGSESVVEVKAKITNQELLKSRFNVDVDILCERREGVLTVPYEAILTEKDGSKYVFTDTNGVIEKHKIQTGLEGSFSVEIISSDLDEGQQIFLNPANVANQAVDKAGADND